MCDLQCVWVFITYALRHTLIILTPVQNEHLSMTLISTCCQLLSINEYYINLYWSINVCCWTLIFRALLKTMNNISGNNTYDNKRTLTWVRYAWGLYSFAGFGFHFNITPAYYYFKSAVIPRKEICVYWFSNTIREAFWNTQYWQQVLKLHMMA